MMLDLDEKICQPHELSQRLSTLPRPLVFTNGVFDIMHRGHVQYLAQARALGASLVVGLNTDSSVRLLGKGANRPYNSEYDRAMMLAALSSVSMVTFFDDKTPMNLIQEIRPDIYVKGGDYDMAMLPEAHFVCETGGQAIAIEFTPGYSTTAFLQRVKQTEALPQAMQRVVFLDRDGVINRDKSYVGRWSDFEFMPNAIEGLKRFQDAGFALVIVTNQSGIARGYYTEEDYAKLTARMLAELKRQGIHVTAAYHCPHHPQGVVSSLAVECACRKPLPGLMIQAANDLAISLPHAILVGDRLSDIQAARAANLQAAYLIVEEGGHWTSNSHEPVDGVFPDLLACAKALTGG
jgi:rfaE bifunctional protein nucleotidyltransferase chain/domain